MVYSSVLNFAMNYPKGEKSDQNTREYDILSTNLNTYDKILKHSIRIAKHMQYLQWECEENMVND